MLKKSYVRKENDKWCVRSKKNPDWKGGCYGGKSGKARAEARLDTIEEIKHAKNADDGVTKNMHEQLSDIAKYLEKAGLVEDSKQLKDIAYILDAASDDDTFYVDDGDQAADFIPDEQANTENQGYIGGDGTGGGYSMFNVPESARVMARMVQVANMLDKRGLHEEADEMDEIMKEYTEEEKALENMSELPDITNEELEEMARYYSEEDEALDGIDALVGANGHVGTGVTDNQNSGSFQGLSDAYFYRGYGDLEGPSPSASAPGRV